MWHTLLVICGVNGAFLILGVWAARRLIAAPILSLKEGADSVAGGNYSREVPVLTNDEIGDLATAFNRMRTELDITVKALRKSQQELASKASELAAVNTDLEQYAYAVSHDLQEPLRTVAAYSQLLSNRYHHQLDSAANDYLQFIMTGAERMQRLVVDLLSYSRVLHHTAEGVAAVDSAAALESAVASCAAAIAETGARVYHADLPAVLADATEVELVFQNLMTNSLKYRSAAPPEIHVTAAIENGTCTFRFRDNGAGIKPEYHERVFGLFKRLHGRDIPGTGVGLALVRKVIEKHGGRIWVESEEGNGATFVFTMPTANCSSKKDNVAA